MPTKNLLEVEITQAIAAVIPLGESELDVYMLGSQEKRLGIEGIGIALGYTNRWYYDRTSRKSKWLEGLKNKGFKGTPQSLRVVWQDNRDPLIARAIELRDSIKLITYEAIVGKNIRAINLLATFAEIGLEKVVEDAFAGRSVEFLTDKLVHYSQWTYEESEEVFAYNRAEARSLHFGGELEKSDRILVTSARS
jgi:hypothetical protein